MTAHFDQLTETLTEAGGPRHELAEVLEQYLADLERGAPVDRQALLSAHADLAEELRPYLDSLEQLHAATQGMRGGAMTNPFAAGSKGDGAGGDSGAQEEQKVIGDYRILREIGRGGMGVVYEAHQVSLNRRVALKILPFAAVLDQRQIARFRNEAQAAAQLHHPHIVPVFAVGQENGVYYYAMQHIDGKSMEAAIEELRSVSSPPSEHTTRAHGVLGGSTSTVALDGQSVLSSDRSIRTSSFFRSVARLGQEAADALQHAHEFGIVHRDVKPSNLLLDLQGKLWVTDFGLARMQNDRGVTLTGDVVGTLRYMSPEQASGNAALIDARTDVYSLGVTLYELLTLQHAYPGDERQLVLRQIERDEPTPPRRINPSVPVDLETIVLHAMAKARDERYSSAQALADDLGRFLAGEPALARRPGLVDRAAKWARRHRAIVAMAAASVLVVSVISSIGLFMLAREQARTQMARTEAEENFAQAEQNFEQAQTMLDRFGVGMADQLIETPGTEPLRRRLLADTLNYYQQFIDQAGDDPRLRHESALAHFKMGVIAAKLGATAESLAQYAQARELLTALVSAEPRNSELASQLALTHNNLAILAAASGEMAEARDRYGQAIEIQRRLAAEEPHNSAFAAQLAESLSNLGMLFDSQDDSSAAEQLLADAVKLLRPLASAPGSDPRYARNLSIAANNLSYVLAKRDPAAAERASREAVAILERLSARKPNGDAYQDDLALCYNNLAALLSRGGRAERAIEWHRQAAALQEQLVRRSPSVVRYRSDLAISLNNLGVAYCRAERVDESDEPFSRARDLFSTLASDYPDELAYRSSLAALLNNQALALAGAGRHGQAVAIYPQAIEAQRACWQRAGGSKLMQEILSKLIYNYGQSLSTLGRWDAATDAAIARRNVWQGDGERLFGVAAELAGVAEQVTAKIGKDSASGSELSERIASETVATLREAMENGHQLNQSLASDERFSALNHDPKFAALVAELQP